LRACCEAGRERKKEQAGGGQESSGWGARRSGKEWGLYEGLGTPVHMNRDGA
jgi:hypothetical protein